LLINQRTQESRTTDNHLKRKEEILSDAFQMLRSPSLTDREEGIKQLTESPESIRSELPDLYFSQSDQDIRMGLVKAMTVLKNVTYVPALIDAIGVEIGNHCQGNIRRVAACALGEIHWNLQSDCEAFSIAMDKLNWTLQYPDDWGLRYSACMALEGIGNNRARALLHESKTQESDPVVLSRINIALSRIIENNAF